jgi:hypothetical protein
MKKGDWYKMLFGQVRNSIQNNYCFEAAFISYGIIEDRLDSMMRLLNISPTRGVKKKISKIIHIQSPKSEIAFFLKNWDGQEYRNRGIFDQVLGWTELYRNPMQHLLGDPREYHASYGSFHTQNTKDLAIEGEKIARELSAAVMRFKKK